jgi:hypothetical protein
MGPLLLVISALSAAWPEPMSTAELAEQRGGFQLPNGINVAITVQTDTSVDRAVVLRTVYMIDRGPPTLKAFTGTGPSATSAAAAAPNGQGAEPTITYDSRTGIQVTPGFGGPSVLITTGAPHIDADLKALQEVQLGGGSATTAFGTITHLAQNGVEAVRLDAGDLAVTHLAGAAFGSIIENSGNGRVIDTTTSVTIDLGNAGPDVLGSALPRVEALGIDAMQTRIR